MRKQFLDELADKVIVGLAKMPRDENNKVRGKAWLAKKLSLSRVTLNERILLDRFTDAEVDIMKEIGVLTDGTE